MDFCVTEEMTLPECSQESLPSNKLYNYYSIRGRDSSYICSPLNKDLKLIQPGIERWELENILQKKIEERLHYQPSSEKVLKRMLEMADVNHDGNINLPEANNMWLMLNNKHSFYILALAGKSYVPSIKDFCGSCLEVEKIMNKINVKSESYFQKVLQIKPQWFMPEWNYRCKIAIGILEFFLDAISFNPNDEFGNESLYLCSSIEESFGNTFNNEAMLINYDNILNGRELQKKLLSRYCASDSDCIYSQQCKTRCNLKNNRCTSSLVKPQIVQYCDFLKSYLLDNQNVTHILEPILEKCLDLKSISDHEIDLYAKNEMPLSYQKHAMFIERTKYWNESMNYAYVTNKLRTTLWNFVKFSKEPQKARKKTTKQPEITNHK